MTLVGVVFVKTQYPTRPGTPLTGCLSTHEENVYVLVVVPVAAAPTSGSVAKVPPFGQPLATAGGGGGFAADAVPISTTARATTARVAAPKSLCFMRSFLRLPHSPARARLAHHFRGEPPVDSAGR